MASDQDREGRQADQRQPPVAHEHEDQDRDNGKQVGNDGDQSICKNIIDGFNIIDGTGSEGTDGRFIELGQVQSKYLSVHFYTQVFHHGLSQPGSEEGEPETESGFYQQ